MTQMNPGAPAFQFPPPCLGTSEGQFPPGYIQQQHGPNILLRPPATSVLFVGGPQPPPPPGPPPGKGGGAPEVPLAAAIAPQPRMAPGIPNTGNLGGVTGLPPTPPVVPVFGSPSSGPGFGPPLPQQPTVYPAPQQFPQEMQQQMAAPPPQQPPTSAEMQASRQECIRELRE